MLNCCICSAYRNSTCLPLTLDISTDAMSRLLKGGQKETLEPKLDLKALQSFSPDWSPDLRYTACIAARYAAHACAEQAREVVERGAIQATCEKGEERMEKFEEEGDDTDKAAPTEQQRQRRRVDFIEDWAEFAQKVRAKQSLCAA